MYIIKLLRKKKHFFLLIFNSRENIKISSLSQKNQIFSLKTNAFSELIYFSSIASAKNFKMISENTVSSYFYDSGKK